MRDETPNTRKLLVVEDNPRLSQTVGAVAKQLNLEIETVSDGWDAIERLEKHDDYKAIVVDIDLPQKSGYGVLTFLRQERGCDLGNLILMTSGDASLIREKMRNSTCHVVSSEGNDLETGVFTEA